MPTILAGDIGGTKVRVGLFETADGTPARVPRAARTYASREYDGLESICRDFMSGVDAKLGAAAFGIAGPIVDGRTEATNLPWVIERSSLEDLLACPVGMINDLEATAHGIPRLQPDEIHVLNEGSEVEKGARAIIAAGTGLGQGYMVWDEVGGQYEPHASEGGHTDFGPRDDEEIALLRHLREKHGRVSAERIVSGMGIEAIFRFLVGSGRYDLADEVRREVEEHGARAVSKRALDGSDPACCETMRRFVAAYGAEAGNLALKVMALGGVFVGGGIAPKILPLMTGGPFMEAFLDKGRFRPLMKRMPVRVVLNEETALLGAATVAARLAGRR